MKPTQSCLCSNHEPQTRLTDFIGIFSQLILHEKIPGLEDLQAGSSTSKDQPVLVGHGEEAGALFGEIVRSVEDADLLQCSELKILLWERADVAVRVQTKRKTSLGFLYNNKLKVSPQELQNTHIHATTGQPITFSVFPK